MLFMFFGIFLGLFTMALSPVSNVQSSVQPISVSPLQNEGGDVAASPVSVRQEMKNLQELALGVLQEISVENAMKMKLWESCLHENYEGIFSSSKVVRLLQRCGFNIPISNCENFSKKKKRALLSGVLSHLLFLQKSLPQKMKQGFSLPYVLLGDHKELCSFLEKIENYHLLQSLPIEACVSRDENVPIDEKVKKAKRWLKEGDKYSAFLNLNKKSLCFLHSSVCTFPSLYLDLSDNQIRTLPYEEMKKMKKLERIYLHGNPIATDKVALKKLKEALPNVRVISEGSGGDTVVRRQLFV